MRLRSASFLSVRVPSMDILKSRAFNSSLGTLLLLASTLIATAAVGLWSFNRLGGGEIREKSTVAVAHSSVDLAVGQENLTQASMAAGPGDFDLALKTFVDSSFPTTPVAYGDTVKYLIRVYNQGTTTADSIYVYDTIPDGLELIPGLNGIWDATNPSKPTTLIDQLITTDDSVELCIYLRTRPSEGIGAWTHQAEIYQAQSDLGVLCADSDSPLDTDPTNNAGGAPGSPADDYLDGDGTGLPGDGVASTDQDNADVARVEVIDMALIKFIDSSMTSLPLVFDSLVKFNFVIVNQGNVVIDSTRIVDYAPVGFEFDPLLPQNMAEGWQPDASLMLTDRLHPTETDTACIYHILRPVVSPDSLSWTNYGEILEVYDTLGVERGAEDYDSEPGSHSGPEQAVLAGQAGDNDLLSISRDSIGSEDDHDPAGVTFVDFALYKQVDSTETNFPLRYGDLVKFNIYVVSQEGVAADSVQVKDYVPAGLAFDPTIAENVANGWQPDTTAWVGGPFMVGDTLTTCIYLQVAMVDQASDRSWTNYAEIVGVAMGNSSIGTFDIDSEPGSNSPSENAVQAGQLGDDDILSTSADSVGSEDDHDPAWIEVFDLALRKTGSDTVAWQGLVTKFTIEILNQGNQPATNIKVVDHVNAGYNYLVAQNIPEGWTLDNDTAIQVITDTLYPGEIDTLCLYLQVNAILDADSLLNVAEIASAEDTTGVARSDFDGVFDGDPSNDAGGLPFSPSDNSGVGDASGAPGDSDADTDEDNMDVALLLPCSQVACLLDLNFSLDPNCMRVLTPDIFLVDNAIALVAPHYYELVATVGNGMPIPGNVLKHQHVGQDIMVTITWVGPSGCTPGTCMTMLQLKGQKQPFISGGLDTTVYCHDPFLRLDPEAADYPYAPEASQSCGGLIDGPHFGGDWIDAFDCSVGDNDTAKIIYRQWYAISSLGERVMLKDTIRVLRLPPLTILNLHCRETDTLYCGSDRVFGPFIVLPNPGGNTCDTMPLLDESGELIPIPSKCGLSISVETMEFGGNGCSDMVRYEVEIFQSCYGSAGRQVCPVPSGPGQPEIEGGEGLPIVARCEFWLVTLDTTPPTVSCDLSSLGEVDLSGAMPIAIVTAEEDCARRHAPLPAVQAYDACNDIKLVKAMITGVGAFVYTHNPLTDRYEATAGPRFERREEPYQIIVEAYDECHNIARDTCYLLITDEIRPVAVAHDGLTLDLGSKKVWLRANEVDNYSYDNCELNQVLIRRSDWAVACVRLCDSIRAEGVTSTDDTLWCAVLETDHALDEVEATYAQEINWLGADGQACSDMLQGAWHYALCHYATVTCLGVMDEDEFHHAYQEVFGPEGVDQYAQLGGGWATATPFDCSDACTEVTVELLVTDFFCNWSRSWSEILVEDKTSASIVADVTPDLQISCHTYREDSAYTLDGQAVPLADLVEGAEQGDSAALAALDAALGTYLKAWVDPTGQYVDEAGVPLEPIINFRDLGVCTCSTRMERISYFDPLIPDFAEREETIRECGLTEDNRDLANGIILVNCNENTFCSQTVVSDLDDCGEGTITRRFFIWKTCGTKEPDIVEVEQVIQVQNFCEFSSDLFSLPSDTLLYACAPIYDPAGSGNVVGPAHPDSIGRPQYLLDDCRVVGIGHSDKELEVRGGSGAWYVIQRTWLFAEWCDDNDGDFSNPADSFIQYIVYDDTLPPTCEATVAGQTDDTITIDQCQFGLDALATMFDTCGLVDYTYALDTLERGGFRTVVSATIDLPGNARDTAMVQIPDVPPGVYRLRVRTRDLCGNDVYCIDSFVVVSTQVCPTVNSSRPPNVGAPFGTAPQIEVGQFALFQNRPNPYRDDTSIGFYLPEDTKADLTVYDIQGRILKVVKGFYRSGYHEIRLARIDVGATGTLFYQLDTERYTATRKMIKLE